MPRSHSNMEAPPREVGDKTDLTHVVFLCTLCRRVRL